MREAPFVERVDCSLQLLARAIGSSKVGKRKGYRDREREWKPIVGANVPLQCTLMNCLLWSTVDNKKSKIQSNKQAGR